MSILILKNQPVLNQKLYDTYEEAINCSFGDISLEQNTFTGIITNILFDPNKIIYDTNYACDQSLSKKFSHHLFNVESIINKYFKDLQIIEIGCGKGFFVNQLAKNGYKIHGYDTTYFGDNENITKSYFNGDSKIKGDGLILRHVLEHIPNPLNFLMKLKEDNNNRGLIYIEVPCFEWILKNKTFYDIGYEHVNYFRKEDFKNIFNKILEIGNIFDGQYIYLVADLASINNKNEFSYTNVKIPDDFHLGIEKTAEYFNPNRTSLSLIWGAAGKGAQYSVAIKNNYLNYNVKYAVDLNFEKQNKFLPISGTKVISPIDALSVLTADSSIIIMNPVYESEIRDMTNNLYKYILA